MSALYLDDVQLSDGSVMIQKKTPVMTFMIFQISEESQPHKGHQVRWFS